MVSAKTGGISLAVGPGRLVLEGPVGGESAVGQLVVHVAAPFRVRITATLADAALGADGTPAFAPLGSTAWTLRDVVTLTGNAFDYQPGFDTATFPVTVAARPPGFEQPRVGLVVVTAVPVVGGAGSARASVWGIVVTGPDATSAPAVADMAPRLAVDGLAITRQRLTGIDTSLGDPWGRLLDHGPATLTWRYFNNGNAVGETATTFRISELGPLGWLPFVHDDGTLVRAVDSVQRLVLPGQEVTETLSTDLPAFGAVRISVRTTSMVAGLEAPAAEQSVVLVIAPWKEILVLFAGLLGLAAALLLMRAGARKVRARGQPLRRTEVQAFSPVDGIRERTAPVHSFGMSTTPESALEEAPAEPVPAPATPAPSPAPDRPRRHIQAPPPRSGTPTV